VASAPRRKQPPPSPYDDLQSLLDHLRIERAVLVGHSFAGGLALDFCLERPERVIAVVAETPALGGFAYSRAFKERNATIFSAYQSGGGEALVESILSDPFLAPRERQAKERVRGIVPENVSILETDPGLMRAIEPLAVDRLEEIRQPLLIISAEHDHPDNGAVVELLERRVANARRVELKGAAHLAHLDQPQTFNELIREFMQSLPATGKQMRSY
jgi:pimeloyl-ACP methyl ester carboxylesterase